MKIPIEQIDIGDRFREDMGDLQSLADSIKAQGLLQPVGVTAEHVLVFGERRLRACRDVLGWTEIEVRVVNVTSIVEGEHDENEVRKDFTVSERVAIGQAIEGSMAERRGRNNPQNVAELKGKETRQIAAKKAGFGNAESYRQAKTITDRGTPELVEKVDAGEVSVSAGALIAKQPVERQVEIISPKDQKRLDAAVRELRAAKEFADEVAAMPKAEPRSQEDREALAQAVGTREERANVVTILEIAETVSGLPEAGEVAEHVPPAIEHAIREELSSLEAVSDWFDAFLAAWKAKEKTYDPTE